MSRSRGRKGQTSDHTKDHTDRHHHWASINDSTRAFQMSATRVKKQFSCNGIRQGLDLKELRRIFREIANDRKDLCRHFGQQHFWPKCNSNIRFFWPDSRNYYFGWKDVLRGRPWENLPKECQHESQIEVLLGSTGGFDTKNNSREVTGKMVVRTVHIHQSLARKQQQIIEGAKVAITQVVP